MVYLKEAKDLSRYQIFDDKLKTIYQKDELVQAWHGTSMFWALWFCMYGVDTTVEPPAKTLGRGTMETGFGRIDTKGLFVSASELSGFRTLIQFEVKPSELGISLEMEQRGYKPDQVLDSLVAGDCIVVKNLPAKRVIQVKHNNKVFTRKEFIAKFPDPKQYLENEYRQNMLSGTSLRSKYEKEIIYSEYKKELASGGMTIEEAIESINEAIKHNDLEFWGITEEDAEEILNWLKGKVMTEKRIIFFESDLTAKEFLEGRYSSTGRSTDSPKRAGTNKKMSPEVYRLRRIVMNYIYEAKKLLNGNMDRVEIRIVDLSPEKVRLGSLGYAFLGDHIIWISEHTLTDKRFKPFLKEIVFHELLHANYGISHNKINLLMSPYMPKIPTPSKEVDREFLEQIERNK